VPGSAAGVGIHLRPADHTAAADSERLRTSSAAATGDAWTAPLAEQARAGWDAYMQGDTRAARETLAEPAANPAAPPWVHYVLGWAAFAESGFAQARTEWQVVRRQVPDFQPVYFDLADAYLRDRRAREAAGVLRDAAVRWPASVDVLNAVGVVFTSLGDLDQAIAAFERALTSAPGDAVASFNLAAASEIRYVASIRPSGAAEIDRSHALELYRAVFGLGGPLAGAAREGLWRLSALDVTQLTCAAPARIASVRRDQLTGRPSMLAWSADGRLVYLGGVVAGMGAEQHFVVSVDDARIATPAGRPDWARAYWQWKAAQRAPWLPATKITAQTKRVTGFNMSDPGNSERGYARAADQSMSNELTLHGHVIAEASSGAVVAGMTFGWAPFAMGAIAFADSRGRLVLMDVEGRQLRVDGADGVVLPAWSPDGRQVAFLKRESNAYAIYVVRLSAAQG
jgi:tetratricopeptide (TPR) repeat protein